MEDVDDNDDGDDDDDEEITIKEMATDNNYFYGVQSMSRQFFPTIHPSIVINISSTSQLASERTYLICCICCIGHKTKRNQTKPNQTRTSATCVREPNLFVKQDRETDG